LGVSKPSDLTFASASRAAEAIRAGEVTSAELTNHILERIERFNPSLIAIVTLNRNQALARAREADEAIARGEIWGPLHGVPITVKDCFETAGVLTTAGSPSLSDHVPEEDAPAVVRLRAAGAVILGHTNSPVMAGDWQTYNEIFGTTNNPWDPAMTPGGSTGGGAAALAAGLTYLSLGSDHGGSIRVPAHFCGLYGHKPSIGVVPFRGHIPQVYPPLLPVAGPLARSPEDLMLALRVMGGPDSNEAIAYDWSLPPARGERLSDYRIGYVLDHPNCPISGEVKEAIASAIEKLKGKVASLDEGWPPDVDPVAQWATRQYLGAFSRGPFLKEEDFEAMRERAKAQDGSRESIQALAWTAPFTRFQRAYRERTEAREVWLKYFKEHDAFIVPVSFTTAFPHNHSEPFWDRRIPTTEGPRAYEDLVFWVSFATLAGLPATVAPVGTTASGLPVGIQIIGPYLEDATPIDVAAKTAGLFGGFKPPEGYR
jgi:amidase